MIGFVRRMWAAAPWATAGLGVALVLAAFFAFRAVNRYIYWSDPAHHDQTIAGWMPLRYVATSWHVPPEVIGDALGLNTETPRRLTIDELAQDRGVSVEALAKQLQDAITAFRAAHPQK